MPLVVGPVDRANPSPPLPWTEGGCSCLLGAADVWQIASAFANCRRIGPGGPCGRSPIDSWPSVTMALTVNSGL